MFDENWEYETNDIGSDPDDIREHHEERFEREHDEFKEYREREIESGNPDPFHETPF